MAENKSDFVVHDRRRFAPEGELRPEAQQEEAQPEEEKILAPPQVVKTAASSDPMVMSPAGIAEEEEGMMVEEEEDEALPPPPSDAEQKEQHEAYKASGKKIDDLVNKSSGARGLPPEMNFARLVESFYMTALMQLGAYRQEGEQPRVDILGARQTIDSLTVLQEKTKGNLTDEEQTLLQNVLFELRMAWIEITNAIANAPPPGQGPRIGGPGISKR
ncbi:MAG TPA: DUF1844 domain-containing protein [Candidatus Angelobacter sp.]|nr:DUF1844 domain-containing protein [Candidatus Angelobacter sp.]